MAAIIMWLIWRLFETLGSIKVAWLHAYLLKGRSICKVTCSVDSSWDLRKKKKKKSSILRGNLDLLMRYKVGNGHQIDQYIYTHTHTQYIFLHDNWHPKDPLLQNFGIRIICDTATNNTSSAKLFDIQIGCLGKEEWLPIASNNGIWLIFWLISSSTNFQISRLLSIFLA